MQKEVILAGYSGHAFVTAEALLHSGYKLAGYFDGFENKNSNLLNLLYLGSENDLVTLEKYNNYSIFPSVGDNIIRERIFLYFFNHHFNIPNAINNQANISNLAKLNKGILLCRGANVNPFCVIGNGAIINTGSIIEHECVIGDFAHIGPGAVLAGNVEIGERSFIGANSVIKQGVKIGKDVIIGAGSVVLNDVLDQKIIIGNPGKEMIK